MSSDDYDYGALGSSIIKQSLSWAAILIRTVSIFSLVGFGIALTGVITLSQLGVDSTIFSGVLVLVILLFAFLLGPVLAVVTGLRIGDRYGRSIQTLIAGGVGAVSGYFSMMLIVVMILSMTIITISGDGGSGAAAQSSTSNIVSESSGGGLNIGKIIIPILIMAIPTTISGLGGVSLSGGKYKQEEMETVSIFDVKSVSSVSDINTVSSNLNSSFWVVFEFLLIIGSISAVFTFGALFLLPQ